MPLPTLLSLLALLLVSASIVHQDWRDTCVSVWKLALFVAMSAVVVGLSPFAGTAGIEHLIGGLIGAGLGAGMGYVLERRLGRVAFGGADTWILAGGGLVVGLQWIGPWLLISTTLGLAGFAARIARPDPITTDGRAILPFAPILLISLWVVVVLRALQWAPAQVL